MPTTGKQLGTDFANSTRTFKVAVNACCCRRNMPAALISWVKGMALFLLAANQGSNSTDTNAFTAGPQLVMSGNQSDPSGGNSMLTLNANQGIKISGVSDAMVLNHNGTQFFTYTDKAFWR